MLKEYANLCFMDKKEMQERLVYPYDINVLEMIREDLCDCFNENDVEKIMYGNAEKIYKKLKQNRQ